MRRPQSCGSLFVRVLSLTVVMCHIAGCSIFGPMSQSIDVRSDPPGAQVIVSGKPMGETPLRVEVDRGENLLLEVQKSGYQTQYRASSRTLSILGTLDVVSGFFWLVPFIGLLSSGAWQHDPVEFEITLVPEKQMTPTP